MMGMWNPQPVLHPNNDRKRCLLHIHRVSMQILRITDPTYGKNAVDDLYGEILFILFGLYRKDL